MKIVIFDDWENIFRNSPSIQDLSKHHDIMIYSSPSPSDLETVSRLEGAEILVLIRERTALTKSIIQKLSTLKLVIQTGTGYAHLDIAALKDAGARVINMPDVSADSVSELTFALIFSCLRKLSEQALSMHRGGWIRTPGRLLKGKTLGIIGFGSIGKTVAKTAESFKANVIVWSPTLGEEKATSYGVKAVELDELMCTADIVSLHLRSVPKFYHLVNRNRLFAMKPDSIFINTSRSALVDTSALIEAIKMNGLSVGMDVFDTEPLEPDHPLRFLPNVTLTAHLGWLTHDLLEEFAEQSAVYIDRFSQGDRLPYITDK